MGSLSAESGRIVRWDGLRWTRRLAAGPLVLVVFALLPASAGAAQPPVGLGTAASFAVLAGSTVTNTGPSTLNGDLGVDPGTAITGFPPGTVNGATHAADAVAAQAQSDLTTAYNDAAGRTPAAAITSDLGGQTLTPGVYRSASSIGLTGELTLDGAGDAGAVFIFQAGATLTTATGSRVTLVNGAQACNVFWQIGSSATLGTTSVFTGDLLALTSISMKNGVTMDGHALARNGAVTLINDTVTASRCADTATPPGQTPPGTTPPGETPPGTTPPGGTPPGTGPATPAGTATFQTRAPRVPSGRCVHGTFRAVVTGHAIRRVVFTRGGHRLASIARSPFAVIVGRGTGIRTILARVTFTDGTTAKTLRMRYRACAAARRSPARRPRGPSGFTG